MTEPIHVADPYRALGVARGATDAEIKAAHRKLAKRFHPDAGGSDTRRFLRVQEAYRVLSDPLLRREWDARHAPGPVRAKGPARPTTRAARARPAAAETEQPDTPPRPSGTDPRREPRTSRAYTWSAGEVPWWEDAGTARPKRRARSGAARQEPGASAPAEPSQSEPHNEFDVYNRSSGAAWSMAARAYFRRGDQELPRRGSFRHEGTQPLTAARARAAAEQDARRAAAAQPAAARQPTPAHRPAAPAAHARESTVRRSIAAAGWPSTGQRLVYALIAWLPVAVLIVLAGTVVGDGARARVDEVIQGALMALTLGIFFAVPRLAYIASVANLGLLGVGLLLVGGLAVLGIPQPLGAGLTAALAAALALGYLAIAGIVTLGPPSLRPWTRQPQPVRSR